MSQNGLMVHSCWQSVVAHRLRTLCRKFGSYQASCSPKLVSLPSVTTISGSLVWWKDWKKLLGRSDQVPQMQELQLYSSILHLFCNRRCRGVLSLPQASLLGDTRVPEWTRQRLVASKKRVIALSLTLGSVPILGALHRSFLEISACRGSSRNMLFS